MTVTDLALTAFVRLSAATPSPAPDFNDDTVTPGLIGFIVMFLIAVAATLLAIDMVRRVRRTTYRAQVAEQLEAEQAERDRTEREGADSAGK